MYGARWRQAELAARDAQERGVRRRPPPPKPDEDPRVRFGLDPHPDEQDYLDEMTPGLEDASPAQIAALRRRGFIP